MKPRTPTSMSLLLAIAQLYAERNQSTNAVDRAGPSVSPTPTQSAPERRNTAEACGGAPRSTGTPNRPTEVPMLRSIALILLFLVPSGIAGCTATEEIAAGDTTANDSRSVSNPTTGSESDSDSQSESNSIPAVLNLNVIPLAHGEPVISIDPFRQTITSLSIVYVENQGPIPTTVTTLHVAHALPCDLVQTLSLTLGTESDQIVSDGNCQNPMEFTLDVKLMPHQGMTLRMWAYSMPSASAAIAAAHIDQSCTLPGILFQELRTDLGNIHLSEHYRGNSIRIVPYAHRIDQVLCESPNDDFDASTIGAAFKPEQEPDILPAHNRLFATELQIFGEHSNIARNQNISLTIQMLSEDVMITAAELITAEASQGIPSGSLAAHAIITQSSLQFSIPGNIAKATSEYLLFLHAPNQRGAVTLWFDDNSLIPTQVHPSATLIGCYPSQSHTFLVLPTDEWQVLNHP